MSGIRRCPACKTRVAPTVKGNIESHNDTAGAYCEASGEPYRIAFKSRPLEARRRHSVAPARRRQLQKAMIAENHRRHVEGARKQVAEARVALRAVTTHSPTGRFRTHHRMYTDVLASRVANPRLTLAELAFHLGVSKDTYSGRLRRALAYAQRLQERAA